MRTVLLFFMCFGFLLLRGHDHACAHQNHKSYSHLQFANDTKKQTASVKKSSIDFGDSDTFVVESEDEDFFVSLRYIPTAFAVFAICFYGYLSIKRSQEKFPLVALSANACSNMPKFLLHRTIRL